MLVSAFKIPALLGGASLAEAVAPLLQSQLQTQGKEEVGVTPLDQLLLIMILSTTSNQRHKNYAMTFT